MGTTLSNYHNGEVPFVPIYDISITDGDIRRLWSCNSTKGDRYIQITDQIVPAEIGQCFVVAATGEIEGLTMPLTDIKFNRTQLIPQMFQLSFQKNETWYTAHAADTSALLTASSNNDENTSDTSFEVIPLFSPNRPYIVLRSNKKQGEEHLYLSCDGAGDLRLKVWNKPVQLPPTTTAEVDPAFLFRLVRPLQQN